jgi:hypothetical protein
MYIKKFAGHSFFAENYFAGMAQKHPYIFAAVVSFQKKRKT